MSSEQHEFRLRLGHLVLDENLFSLSHALIHHLVKSKRLPNDGRLVEVFFCRQVFERSHLGVGQIQSHCSFFGHSVCSFGVMNMH